MDSFEINKILGALLFTILVLVALNITADAIFSPRKPAKPGYEIAVQEQPGKGKAAAPAEKEEPVEVALATASIDKGKSQARKCAACHTFEKGGPNRVGPNLWGIVGRDKGSHPGFAYSDAMKKKGGKWTVEDLYHFIRSPRDFVPGTKMSFAGLPRSGERADVIAYLNTLSDNPQPLPKAAEKPTAPAPQKGAEKPKEAPKAAAAPQAAPNAAPPATPPAPAKTEAPAKSEAPAASPPPAAAPAATPAPAEPKPQ
jgi:cytochrome c